jgi:hypothetical protein
MTSEKPCCSAAAARMMKRLTIAGGSEVGIVNLEGILKEVAAMKLADDSAVKQELLRRVRIYNYVPSSADSEYSEALLREYREVVRRQL